MLLISDTGFRTSIFHWPTVSLMACIVTERGIMRSRTFAEAAKSSLSRYTPFS